MPKHPQIQGLSLCPSIFPVKPEIKVPCHSSGPPLSLSGAFLSPVSLKPSHLWTVADRWMQRGRNGQAGRTHNPGSAVFNVNALASVLFPGARSGTEATQPCISLSLFKSSIPSCHFPPSGENKEEEEEENTSFI